MNTLKTLIIFVVVVISGCDKPELNALPSNATILAFGDSLTAGKGTTPEQSYPTVLAGLSGRDVINAGISGETTAQGLRRLPRVLEDTDPDLLLLMHGGNDILRNLPATDAKANLNAMIELAKGRGVQVVLVGVPERKLLSSVAPIYEELADEHNLVLQKGMISSLLKKPSLKSDAVHFNADGYAAIASTLHELLADHGAY